MEGFVSGGSIGKEDFIRDDSAILAGEGIGAFVQVCDMLVPFFGLVMPEKLPAPHSWKPEFYHPKVSQFPLGVFLGKLPALGQFLNFSFPCGRLHLGASMGAKLPSIQGKKGNEWANFMECQVVRQWFAKPSFEGSIPSSASKFSGRNP